MVNAVVRCLAGAGTVVALVGCVTERRWVGSVVAPTPEQLRAEGRETYARACASCHGANGRGHGPEAPATTSPPDLTTLARDNGGVFPRAHVARVISGQTPVGAHGSREMPVWHTRFDPSTSGATAAAALRMARWLDGLVDYLETLQRAS